MMLSDHELLDEPAQYDQYGKLMLSRRAIKKGLAFCVVFYSSLFAIVGGGFWIVRHFL
jgi:hypothetical protein